MAYQKCPVCKGVGKVLANYYSERGNTNAWAIPIDYEPCHACRGVGIIDEVTGQPPQERKEGE